MTVADVSTEVAVWPAVASSLAKAMLKQPACAAAMSSSGLVPTPSSKRDLKLYWVALSVVLWVVMVPVPALRSPCQMADALRSM